MATVAHLFAGVTDYFRAFGAKNYYKVTDNARSRFNPEKLSRQRTQNVAAFREKLSQNSNLTESQVDLFTSRRNTRHAIGDFFENSFGAIGSAGSIVGGTLGYATKKAITAPFKAPGQLKRGANELDELGKLRTAAKEGGDDARIAVENAEHNLSRNAKNMRAGGAVGGAVAGGGVLGGGVKGLLAAGEQVADGALPLMPGVMGSVKEAMPSIKYAAEQVAITNRIGKPIRNEIKNTAGAINEAIGPAVRFAGRGAKEYGQNMGRDAWRGAKWFHENRHSRAVTIGAGVGAMALMSSSYEGGQQEAKYMRKLQQMGSQVEVSEDGGGTFLRPNQSPQVENMGATGDLVFAMHALRNGG